MSLSVSFQTCLRRRGDILMGRRYYVLFRRRHDAPIRRRRDVPLRRLSDVSPRRLIWGVLATSMRLTERRCYEVVTTSCCRVGLLFCRNFEIWARFNFKQHIVLFMKTFIFCSVVWFPLPIFQFQTLLRHKAQMVLFLMMTAIMIKLHLTRFRIQQIT